jgi:hypothetical protein
MRKNYSKPIMPIRFLILRSRGLPLAWRRGCVLPSHRGNAFVTESAYGGARNDD